MRTSCARSWSFLQMALVAIAHGCAPTDYPTQEDSDGIGDGGLLEDKQLPSLTYQAESRTSASGCVQANNFTGYGGSGFMDFGGQGTWIELANINAPAAGKYALRIRYANGSAASRNATIMVNGASVGTLPFPVTGSWAQWSTDSIAATLRQGTNTVRVTASGSAGGPNLDQIDVVATDLCPSDPNKVEPGACGCGVAETGCRAGCAQVPEGSTATLACPAGQLIASIDFASYGSPVGSCTAGLTTGTCHASTSKTKVQSSCLNEQSCSVDANNTVFGDSCPGVPKALAVKYSCSGRAREYYGTNVPSYIAPIPAYQLFEDNVLLQGGLDGLSHTETAAQGAGKFVFNRIYRSSKHGVGQGEQYGIFHWWLGSYGKNSIEGGLWVIPRVAGPHYYPTLHVAGVGDTYHTCSDVQFGTGMGESFIGDKWLAMIQLSNRVLTVPGVNIAFDKNQPPYDADNGIWVGWGWTNLNLDHPSGYKFWMSFIESYNYQGPVNGYIPEYFNWVDPKKIANGSYAASRASSSPFGTFSTLGASPNGAIANEQYSRGLHLRDNIYYVPVPRVPSYKNREYIVANIQGIRQGDMEAYSSAIKSKSLLNSLIPTQFLPFTGVISSTHSQLKIAESIGGKEHLTVVRPPYNIGHDTYNGYIDWSTSSTAAQQASGDQNGYLYYQKSSEHWPVEADAAGNLKNHPNLYKGVLISPPDSVRRVPHIDTKFFSYKERNTKHPDFANWDTTGKKRYTTLLQNGSTATYVWFKFIEQPAVKTAKQNWPSVYTDAYLARLQTYIENLHRTVAQRSKVNPSSPVFINSRNANDPSHFDPHLVKVDPGQSVVPPPGFEVGYVPVIISVYHPAALSSNGTGLEDAPRAECLNSRWTRTYFPDI